MARITLDEIAQELAKENWKVLSTDYTNLSTEMKFECPEGHFVFSSWEKLRRKRECPVCKQNVLKENKPVIIEKKKDTTRVLALDQSSHITGYSILDGGRLVKYGIFEAPAAGDTNEEVERFHAVKTWLISMIQNYEPDMIGIEGIQYQESFGVTTFQTLARLQGVLMELCYEMKIPFKICSTNTWRAYCGVKGQKRVDKKRSMQLLVKQWFDITVTDDEADAIGIGKYVADSFQKQTTIVQWD